MEAIKWDSFFFLFFAVIACAFAVAVVMTGNIVRMAAYLVVSLGAVAGLFFIAGADFLGAVQLMVYVGGTMVLLVFGVMLTARGPFVSMKTGGGQWILATIVSIALLAILLQTAFSMGDWSGTKETKTATTNRRSRPDLRKTGTWIVRRACGSTDSTRSKCENRNVRLFAGF